MYNYYVHSYILNFLLLHTITKQDIYLVSISFYLDSHVWIVILDLRKTCFHTQQQQCILFIITRQLATLFDKQSKCMYSTYSYIIYNHYNSNTQLVLKILYRQPFMDYFKPYVINCWLYIIMMRLANDVQLNYDYVHGAAENSLN